MKLRGNCTSSFHMFVIVIFIDKIAVCDSLGTPLGYYLQI